MTGAFCQGAKNQRNALLHVLLLVLLLQAPKRICLAIGLTPPEERGVGFPVAALMGMQPASLVRECKAQSVGGGLKRLDLAVEHIHLLCSTNISGLLCVNDLLPFPAVDESERRWAYRCEGSSESCSILHRWSDERLQDGLLVGCACWTMVLQCALENLAAFDTLVVRVRNVGEGNIIPPSELFAAVAVANGI